jgi:hypothetical protein
VRENNNFKMFIRSYFQITGANLWFKCNTNQEIVPDSKYRRMTWLNGRNPWGQELLQSSDHISFSFESKLFNFSKL